MEHCVLSNKNNNTLNRSIIYANIGAFVNQLMVFVNVRIRLSQFNKMEKRLNMCITGRSDDLDGIYECDAWL
jgi:hypothetical protein